MKNVAFELDETTAGWSRCIWIEDLGRLIPFRPNRNTVEVRYVRSPESQFGQTLRRKVNVWIPRRRRVDHHKRFLVVRWEMLPTQLVSEIIFPQTLASLRTWIRTEDADSIEFNTSYKLIIRSSMAAIREVAALMTDPSQEITCVGSQMHLDSFAKKPEPHKSVWTCKLAILAL